jgi:Ran GTPase-activating protein (RanGAP) involved in mRNA processing and transport
MIVVENDDFEAKDNFEILERSLERSYLQSLKDIKDSCYDNTVILALNPANQDRFMPDKIFFDFQKKLFQHISNQHKAELYKEMTEFLDPEYDDEMEAIEMIEYVDGKEESEYVENESVVVQQIRTDSTVRFITY